ncbi:unnamed protein product [Trichobilharzia szidati]|nr:unnamed protein product [Trichobilharzia szidati]
MAKKHQKDGKIKKLERKSKTKHDRPNSEVDCNQSESSQHEIYPHQYHPHYDIERQQQYPQDREHYQPRHHNAYYQHSQQLQQQPQPNTPDILNDINVCINISKRIQIYQRVRHLEMI